MQITKFTTMQNNHASGTQITITQNKLKQPKSPGLVTSNDLWHGKKAGLFSKGKVK